MLTGILFTALIIISIFAVKTYMKNVLRSCCKMGKAKPKKISKEAFPYRKKILIYGMTCAFCKARIENEFNQLEGCYIEVDLKNNCAVLYTMRPIVKEDVLHRIRSLGYHVFKISDVS